MHTRYFSLMIVLAATAAFAESGAADDPQAVAPAPEKLFERMDKNGDGKLTKDELPDPLRERLAPLFQRLGKDALTLEDFTKLRRGLQPRNPAQMFKHLDKNEDGKVTLNEVPERMKPRFERLLEQSEKGKAGGITLVEFQKIAHGQGRSRGPEFGGRGMQRGGPRLLKYLDTNHDGKISKEELEKAAEKFDAMDEDKDGQLTPRELFGFGNRSQRGRFGPPREGGDRFGRDGRFGRSGDRREAMHGRGGPWGGRTRWARGPWGGGPWSQGSWGRGGYGGFGPRGHGRFGQFRGQFGERILKRLDTNDDGKLSEEEALQSVKKLFSRIDANSDGLIEPEELKKAASQWRGQHGHRHGRHEHGRDRKHEQGDDKRPEQEKTKEKEV